jgi:hypothetical protein
MSDIFIAICDECRIAVPVHQQNRDQWERTHAHEEQTERAQK